MKLSKYKFDLLAAFDRVESLRGDDDQILISCVSKFLGRSSLVHVDDLREFCRGLFFLYEEIEESSEYDVSERFNDYFEVVGLFNTKDGELVSFTLDDRVYVGALDQIVSASNLFQPEV